MAHLFFKPRSILVPVKGTNADREAFRLACGLARDSKSKLYALYVIEVKRELPVDAEIAGETVKGEEILAGIEALSAEEKCPVSAEILQARLAGPAVVQEVVERGVDLVIMGASHKRQGGSFRLGGTISYILKNAPCPVLLWREHGLNGGGRA